MMTGAFAEALRRDSAALREQYEAGQWVPEPAERQLAGDLARGQWSEVFFRACLRDALAAVRSGRLIGVVAPAAELLDREGVDHRLVLQLRLLVDALAPEI